MDNNTKKLTGATETEHTSVDKYYNPTYNTCTQIMTTSSGTTTSYPKCGALDVNNTINQNIHINNNNDVNNNKFSTGGAVNVQLLTLENVNLYEDKNSSFSVNLYFNNALYSLQVGLSSFSTNSGFDSLAFGLSQDISNTSTNSLTYDWKKWDTGSTTTLDYLTYLTGQQFNQAQNPYLAVLRVGENIQNKNGQTLPQLGDTANQKLNSQIPNPYHSSMPFTFNNITQVLRTPAFGPIYGSNLNYVSSDLHHDGSNASDTTNQWTNQSEWTNNGGSQGGMQSLFGYYSKSTIMNSSASRNEHFNMIYQKNVIVITGLPGRVKRSNIMSSPPLENIIAQKDIVSIQQSNWMAYILGQIIITIILMIIFNAVGDLIAGWAFGTETVEGVDGKIQTVRIVSMMQKISIFLKIYAMEYLFSGATDIILNGVPSTAEQWLNFLFVNAVWAGVWAVFSYVRGMERFAVIQKASEVGYYINPADDIHIFGISELTLAKVSSALQKQFLFLQIGAAFNNDFTLADINSSSLDSIHIPLAGNLGSLIGKIILGFYIGLSINDLGISFGVETYSAALITTSFIVSTASISYLLYQQSKNENLRYQINFLNWMSYIAQSSQASDNIMVRGFGSFLGILSMFVYHDFVTQRIFTDITMQSPNDPIAQEYRTNPLKAFNDGLLAEYGVTRDPNFVFAPFSYDQPNQMRFTANAIQLGSMFGIQLTYGHIAKTIRDYKIHQTYKAWSGNFIT